MQLQQGKLGSIVPLYFAENSGEPLISMWLLTIWEECCQREGTYFNGILREIQINYLLFLLQLSIYVHPLRMWEWVDSKIYSQIVNQKRLVTVFWSDSVKTQLFDFMQ